MTVQPNERNPAAKGLVGMDPELLELPAPPEGRRLWAVAVMLASLIASVAFLFTTLPEVRYFFRTNAPVELGAAVTLDPGSLAPGRYVTVTGSPMLATEVGYSRLWGGAYRVFALAGQRAVFVQIPRRRQAELEAQRVFSGRLVTFGSLGSRFAPVADFLRDEQNLPVSDETFLVLADEPPSSYAWSLVLFALVLGFVLFNAIFLWRWFLPFSGRDLETPVPRDSSIAP